MYEDYYKDMMEDRMAIPSNFTIDMAISGSNNVYNVETTIEILQGTNSENLALFVVLTEGEIEFPDLDNQMHVAREVYPDQYGLPLDFSSQTQQVFNTEVSLEDEYVFENCEVLVWIQNMDTKEIYQGNSLMMTDITTSLDETKTVKLDIYPNPTSKMFTIESGSAIQNIEMYNHLGQLVKTQATKGNILNFDVSDLEPGIYFIKIFSHDQVITRKLVIE